MDTDKTKNHTSAWVFQCWMSFILAISSMGIGIVFLPVDAWVKGYLGMGYLFSISATISLAKTTRDIHESQRIISRVDEAKLEKLLAEHHPLN